MYVAQRGRKKSVELDGKIIGWKWMPLDEWMLFHNLMFTITLKTEVVNAVEGQLLWQGGGHWWPKALFFSLSRLNCFIDLLKMFSKQAVFSRGSLASRDACPGNAVIANMKQLRGFEGKAGSVWKAPSDSSHRWKEIFNRAGNLLPAAILQAIMLWQQS